MKLNETEKEVLWHLDNGGTIAVRIYGKRVRTMDTICGPSSFRVGLRMLDTLEKAGLICHGEPSPYRSGKSYPILLTELGKTAAYAVDEDDKAEDAPSSVLGGQPSDDGDAHWTGTRPGQGEEADDNF